MGDFQSVHWSEDIDVSQSTWVDFQSGEGMGIRYVVIYEATP